MNDYSHCPTDAGGNPHQYFSPVAPPTHCNVMTTTEYPVHQVPEPSSLALVLLAVAVLAAMRKRR